MERSVLVAIPAYNEEANIKNVISLTKQFGDVVVFDNNSNDNTSKISIAEGAQIILVKEQGYESVIFSILNCFEKSKYSKLVIIDGDGEVGLEVLSQAIKYLDFYDAVIGNRNHKRRVGEKLICMLYKLFYKIDDIYCGFKCFTKKGVNEHRRKGTFATSVVNKNSNIKNIKVRVNLRSQSKLGEGLIINMKLIYSGLKGLLD